MDIWPSLGIFAIGAGAIVFLLKYFGTKFIDHFFDTKLQNLKFNFDKEVESFKASLQKILFEHNVIYSKLHEERAEVIKNIFQKLYKVEVSMGSFLAIFEPAGMMPREERGKIAAKEFNEFIEYYGLNEIYFPDDVSGLINKIVSEIRDAWFKFIAYPSYKNIEHFVPDPELAKIEEAKLKLWIDAWNTMRNDIPPLKAQIKQELQKLIGVIEKS
jgi:hypothetical protein